VITSLPNSEGIAAPIAVFGGADRTFKPFNYPGSSHIEEEMAPFNTWGTDFVGSKAQSYPGVTSNFPSFWRIISACGPAICPSGAKITITPAIAAEDRGGVPINPQFCTTPVGGQVSTCTLPPLGAGETAPWFEFEHASSFSVHADVPITLASYQTGPTFEGTTATQGAPSLTVMPAVQQWVTRYAFPATSFSTNYANLMIAGESGTSCNECGSVSVDGADVPYAAWSNVPGTQFFTAAIVLTGASNPHVVASEANLGLVIYGFDEGVSYGCPVETDEPFVGFVHG
jgi:hypothetical protein